MGKRKNKFLAASVTASVAVAAISPIGVSANSFKDVSSSYEEAVNFLVSKGIKGFSETEFGIQKEIKRVDAAVMLVAVLGIDPSSTPESGFTDVPERTKAHINLLKHLEITSGKTATTFDSNSPITRGELAIWIQKAFKLKGTDKVDFKDVAPRYTSAVSALVESGITQGVSVSEFGTTQKAKRGDFAKFLLRADNVVKNNEDTEEKPSHPGEENAGGESNVGEGSTGGGANPGTGGGEDPGTGGGEDPGEEDTPFEDKNIDDLIIGENNSANFTITKENLDKTKAFGDEDYTTVIEGNVNIAHADAKAGEQITLKNLDIKGDLEVDFGDGDVILENVTVNGVKISDVGEHSIYIKGKSSIGLLIIEDENDNAHVVVSDEANVKNTTVLSGATLEVAEGARNTKPFSNITISPESDREIILSGTFDNINIDKKATVAIQAGTTINNQVKISASSTLKVADQVNVARVEIDAQEEDTIALSGNLNNVTVLGPTTIELVEGEFNISNASDQEITINSAEGVTAEIAGEYKASEESKGQVTKKEELSSEARITNVLFWDYEGSPGSSIHDTPSAITVSELLRDLQLSPFATAVVVDYKGNQVHSDEIITESMQVKVTSEDKKETNSYSLSFERASGSGRTDLEINRIYDEGYDYSEDRFTQDLNSELGKISTSFKFKKPVNEKNVDGYYVSIFGQKIVKESGERKYLSRDIVNQVFVSKDSVKDGSYEAVFKDIDAGDYKMFSIGVRASVNGKIALDHSWELFDNPVNRSIPSVEGIIIDEFTDTDIRKGHIDGTVTFTDANEEHVAFYKVYLSRDYTDGLGGTEVNHRYGTQIGIVEVNDATDGKYTLKFNHTVDVGITDDIYIVVEPSNENGLSNGSENQNVRDVIDTPADEVLKLRIPVLHANGDVIDSLNATNLVEAAPINIYKYNFEKKEYERYNPEYKYNAFGTDYTFTSLPIGKYKIEQVFNDEKSGLSNEAVVKPMKLSGILRNGVLNLVNAEANAVIKVYDGEKVIKEVTADTKGKAAIEGLTKGTYTVTQTVDNIESNKFIVPIESEYTMEQIKQSIVDSFNKANISASLDEQGDIILKKKDDGEIGIIHFDTGVQFKNLSLGNFKHDYLNKYTGLYQIEDRTAVTFNISDTYENLFDASYNGESFYVNGLYDEERFSFNIKLTK